MCQVMPEILPGSLGLLGDIFSRGGQYPPQTAHPCLPLGLAAGQPLPSAGSPDIVWEGWPGFPPILPLPFVFVSRQLPLALAVPGGGGWSLPVVECVDPILQELQLFCSHPDLTFRKWTFLKATIPGSQSPKMVRCFRTRDYSHSFHS